MKQNHRSGAPFGVRRTFVGVLLAATAILVVLSATAWACVPDPPPCRAGVSSDNGNWWTDPASDTLRICQDGEWVYYGPGTEDPPCDSPFTEGKTWRDGVRGLDLECQNLGKDLGYRWIPFPDITPEGQTSLDCWGHWAVKVARDGGRSTTLRMAFGDGSSQTRVVAQGSGTTTLYFNHYFAPPGGGGQDTTIQRATVMETGAWDQSMTYHIDSTTNRAARAPR